MRLDIDNISSNYWNNVLSISLFVPFTHQVSALCFSVQMHMVFYGSTCVRHSIYDVVFESRTLKNNIFLTGRASSTSFKVAWSHLLLSLTIQNFRTEADYNFSI